MLANRPHRLRNFLFYRVVSTRIAAGNEIVGVDDRVSALAAQFLAEEIT
jgi:hypothetical protein